MNFELEHSSRSGGGLAGMGPAGRPATGPLRPYRVHWHICVEIAVSRKRGRSSHACVKIRASEALPD